MTDPSAPHVPRSNGAKEAPPNPEASITASESGAGSADSSGMTETGNGGEDPRVAELTSLVVHLKADFDNYKKRVQKEQASALRTGELEAVKKFLPAFANIERALSAAKGAGESGALVDGLRAVGDQLQGILAQMGVERIPAAGQPFDPVLHDAVAATAHPEIAPGLVVDEYEPGYKADGRALMPAKVRVSTAE